MGKRAQVDTRGLGWRTTGVNQGGVTRKEQTHQAIFWPFMIGIFGGRLVCAV